MEEAKEEEKEDKYEQKEEQEGQEKSEHYLFFLKKEAFYVWRAMKTALPIIALIISCLCDFAAYLVRARRGGQCFHFNSPKTTHIRRNKKTEMKD